MNVCTYSIVFFAIQLTCCFSCIYIWRRITVCQQARAHALLLAVFCRRRAVFRPDEVHFPYATLYELIIVLGMGEGRRCTSELVLPLNPEKHHLRLVRHNSNEGPRRCTWTGNGGYQRCVGRQWH